VSYRGVLRLALARSNSARLGLGSGRRKAGRREDGLGRGGTPGAHTYFTKSFLPAQTNFGRVEVEILGPTESGISPPRRALDAAFRLSSIGAAARQHVHN
jgi:hypothetical protein